jgi:hypothetical protein
MYRPVPSSIKVLLQAPVAHACNPRNSECRDQEDHGSKPPMQLVHEILSQKNPSQKTGLVG